jgi:hypothetical protein
MVSKPLLFYDSGAGGLPYLTAARACLPEESYIYLADRKNFPLGEKAEQIVRQVVLESVSLAVEPGSAETRPEPTEGAPPAQLAKRAELYLHGGVEEQERYRAFARHFGLRYCGLLEDAGR